MYFSDLLRYRYKVISAPVLNSESWTCFDFTNLRLAMPGLQNMAVPITVKNFSGSSSKLSYVQNHKWIKQQITQWRVCNCLKPALIVLTTLHLWLCIGTVCCQVCSGFEMPIGLWGKCPSSPNEPTDTKTASFYMMWKRYCLARDLNLKFIPKCPTYKRNHDF